MKKIVFLSGTRADFGKIKSLITITQNQPEFEVYIFATGMHLMQKYGKTIVEIEKSGFKNIYPFINHDGESNMDMTLANTIKGFSMYIDEIKPDLIIVHGDRVEAMAGAIVGSLNNILVAHVEGGEISGTIDELIRHSISKMSHIHLVSNEQARRRLLQMGELQDTIFNIGSPDIDIMMDKRLPNLIDVKQYYDIKFDDFAILMFHPVTTEVSSLKLQSEILVKALKKSNKNYVVIYPNNDFGSSIILNAYDQLKDDDRFRIFPSIRFEYFLTLLKNAKFIIGNSSAGVREAPVYGTPTINLGSRQKGRNKNIKNIIFDEKAILDEIDFALNSKKENCGIFDFGSGNSDKKFLEILLGKEIWQTSPQKQFVDM